jgi:hypothetical protein
MQSMNESVDQSTESHPPGQTVQDVLTLERQYIAMPEPTIYTGNSIRRCLFHCGTRFIDRGISGIRGLGMDCQELVYYLWGKVVARSAGIEVAIIGFMTN